LSLRLHEDVQALMRCPRCGSAVAIEDQTMRCESRTCGLAFPVVDGVPILIDESKSLFSFSDFTAKRETTFRSSDRALKQAFGRVMPRIGMNIAAERNYARLAELLLDGAKGRPRVLVIGGGVVGKGMEAFVRESRIELVETDVALAPRTAMVADAHDLPFADASFDGVIAQAVLEHVLDPTRVVAEMHRVLKSGGIVFAETPFMQQVHMGPFDFTRFTHLGHRRLFRNFEEIESGVSCGPGMALAWAWQYFLLSFATRSLTRALLRGVASLTAFWLKYFDYWLVRRPGGIDAASGVYFIGRKAGTVLPDRVLVSGYRGGM